MKSGWKTSEFWISATIVLAALLDLAGPRLAEPWDLIAAGLAAACYTISRGLAKRGGTNAELQQQLIGALGPLLGAGGNGQETK